MPQRRNRIARLGETEVKRLAEAAFYSVNESNPDEHGWDLMAELSPSARSKDPKMPVDRDPPPLKLLFQVKSTDNATGSKSVKLSVWRRLCLLACPGYFIVPVFENTDRVQRCFVVHIGEDEIYSLLERLRKLDPDERGKINNKYLSFRYGEGDEIEKFNANYFEDQVLGPIESIDGNYSEWKINLVNQLGYEGRNARVDAIVSVPSGYERTEDVLSDAALGIRDNLDIEYAELRDIRFGEVSDEPVHISEGGATLSIDIDSAHGKVSFKTRDRGIIYEEDCKILVSPFKGEDDRLPKILVDLGYAEIIMSERKNRCKVKAEMPLLSEPVTISRLTDVTKFANFIEDSISRSEIITLTLVSEEEVSDIGKLDFRDLDGAVADREAYRLVSSVSDLIDKCGIPKSTKVKSYELVQQKDVIFSISHIASNQNDILEGKIEFVSSESELNDKNRLSDFSTRLMDERLDPGRKNVFVKGSTIIIGNYKVIFLLAIIGEPSMEDDIVTGATIETVKLIDDYVYRRDSSLPDTLLSELEDPDIGFLSEDLPVIPLLLEDEMDVIIEGS